MTEHHIGAFATVALSWVQHHPGQWDRWLVRRCSTCHHLDWVKLIWVDTRYMTCLYCLSQDVELDELSEPLSAVCNECGARSHLDVEELERRQDASEEDDDEDPPPPDDEEGEDWGESYDPERE